MSACVFCLLACSFVCLSIRLSFYLSFCLPVCSIQARGDKFKFDPLLATELREAAITLGVAGLIDLCDKGKDQTIFYACLVDQSVY